MKKLLNKLLISIIIIILLFNFVIVPQAQAISLGGILLKPITSLLMVPLDMIAFIITCAVGVFSNGFIDWTADWVNDAVDVIENSWANDRSLSDNIGSTISSAGTIQGLGFLTIEDFFSGEIELSNINIFTSQSNNNIIVNVKQAAAEWYYALRNIAAIGLLCALIYTAIRIMLSTIAEDKAHYKDMLVDWVKAVCLVLFIHILMMLILNVTDLIVSLLGDFKNNYSSIAWVRWKLLSDFDITQVVYLIMYGMLIYYTVVFAISYMKRFLYTILLIVIAPIIGLVYAFGKEGKSIFQKWLKEFITNAFLQPYHMVIYTVLFGFVSTLADNGQNLMIAIYSLIVLHFIKDAEKYYRGLFGMKDGVAGIGQADTGVETIERVKKKTTQIVQQVGKVALSVAALAIPAGGIAAGAANAAQAGQAAQAMGAAKDLGDIENGFGGGNDQDLGGLLPENPPDAPNGPDIGGGNELELEEPDEVSIEEVENLEDNSNPRSRTQEISDQRDLGAEEEAYRRAPFDGAVYSPKEKEGNLLDDGNEDGGMAKAKNLEVNTITAQGLEAQQGDLQSMNTSDLDTAKLRAGEIEGDVETDGLDTEELEAEVIEGEKATQGKVHNNRVEDGNYQRSSLNSGAVDSTRVTMGRAFDTVAGGHAGEKAARIWNRSNDIYQKAVDAGADPDDPNVKIGAAIAGADEVLNRGDIDNADMRGVPLEREDGDGTTLINSSDGDAYTTLGINSSTSNENKANTEVEIGGTSSNSNVTVSGISQAAMEKMIKDMIPGGKMSNAEISKIAHQVAQNVGGQVDSRQIENMIKSVTGGSGTTVNVENIGGNTTENKHMNVNIDTSEIKGKVGKIEGSKGNTGGDIDTKENNNTGRKIAKDNPDIGLPEGEN